MSIDFERLLQFFNEEVIIQRGTPKPVQQLLNRTQHRLSQIDKRTAAIQDAVITRNHERKNAKTIPSGTRYREAVRRLKEGYNAAVVRE